MTDMFDIDRRGLLGRLAVLVGATALPADVFAAAPVKAGRRYLPPASYTLVEALADTYVPVTDTPGAIAAGVPEKFDLLLRDWAAPETRTAIVGALAAIDAKAKASDGKAFAQLLPERRKAFLVEYDLTALKVVPRKEKLTGLAAMMAGPAVADPGYGRIKSLMLGLYYTSEIGLTRELVYEAVPGKWVPSFKITPETRPFTSGGLSF